MTYLPGSIGVSRSPGILGKLIRTGEHLHGDGRKKVDIDGRQVDASHWNHAFVIVGPDGGTIEAGAQGVVRNNVKNHPDHLVLGAPQGSIATAVIGAAVAHLGAEYAYVDDVMLGIDCVTHWKLHEKSDSLICSQLAAMCLAAGGWQSPMDPALVMPSTLVLAATAWVRS